LPRARLPGDPPVRGHRVPEPGGASRASRGERAVADYLQLAPFVDYGRAWQSKRPTGEPEYLASVGIGLRWAATIRSAVPLRPAFEIYWGHKLKNVVTPGGNLQDKGVHFQFLLGAF